MGTSDADWGNVVYIIKSNDKRAGSQPDTGISFPLSSLSSYHTILWEGAMANSDGNNNALFSTMVKAGRTTYFVDVKEAKNGNKFISISESRIDADDKKQRTTVRVFGEKVNEFRQAIDEAAGVVAQ
jgi:hypothetical protein